eukprot:SAG11_NODE_562_length_8523_cov_38.875356_7_plen_186_part_00
MPIQAFAAEAMKDKSISGASFMNTLENRQTRLQSIQGLTMGIAMIVVYFYVLQSHFRIEAIAEVQNGIQQALLESKGASKVSWLDIGSTDDYYVLLEEVMIPLLWGSVCGRDEEPEFCSGTLCVWGCTEPEMANYNAAAEMDDGSCYPPEPSENENATNATASTSLQCSTPANESHCSSGGDKNC